MKQSFTVMNNPFYIKDIYTISVPKGSMLKEARVGATAKSENFWCTDIPEE